LRRREASLKAPARDFYALQQHFRRLARIGVICGHRVQLLTPHLVIEND
jgi:hypothetical protein